MTNSNQFQKLAVFSAFALSALTLASCVRSKTDVTVPNLNPVKVAPGSIFKDLNLPMSDDPAFIKSSHDPFPVVIRSNESIETLEKLINVRLWKGRAGDEKEYRESTLDERKFITQVKDKSGMDLIFKHLPNTFVNGINIGCGVDEIASAQRIYPQLKFRELGADEQTSTEKVDYICIAGQKDLTAYKELAAKVIELYSADLQVKDSREAEFLINTWSMFLHGYNNLSSFALERPMDLKLAKDQTYNRGLVLELLQVSGDDGHLQIQSFGEDAVGFQAEK